MIAHLSCQNNKKKKTNKKSGRWWEVREDGSKFGILINFII